MSATPTAERGADRRRTAIIRTRRAVVLAVCAVVALVVVAFGVVGAARAVAHNSAVAQTRDDLRAHAGPTIAAVFTVHAATWQAERAHARALVGGDFARGFAAQLDREPARGVSSVEWRPGDTAVTSAERGSGTVLMTATVTTTRADAAPLIEQRTVSASFTDAGGRWLLTHVEVLA